MYDASMLIGADRCAFDPALHPALGGQVYHLPTYFAAGCDYESGEPRGGRSGHKYGFPKLSRLPCEHVVFHLCESATVL